MVDGEATKFIRTADDLPERFELYGVSLSGCKTIKDDDIRRLKRVSLRELNVDDTSITNVGMAHLKGNDTLTKLSFIGSGVDANCLTLFPNAPFQSLELSGLDDAGMAHIKNLKLLEYLHIEGLELADHSIIDLGGMQNLKGLKFRNSTIPWAGFADLLLPNLTSLGFAGTEVNDEGLASIAKFLKQNSSPKHLDLSNTEVSDDGLKHLSDCQLRKLYLRDTNVSDKGLRHLTNLRSGALFLDRTGVTDAGLLQLPEVGSLDVSSPDVTVAGVAAYKKRFPKAQVHLITPE